MTKVIAILALIVCLGLIVWDEFDWNYQPEEFDEDEYLC